MAKVKVEDIRNVAICGHGSSGKTTLVDRILVKSGAVNANPSVDEGTSICDFDPEEKDHKYTIEASVTHFDHKGMVVGMAAFKKHVSFGFWKARAMASKSKDDSKISVSVLGYEMTPLL